MTYHRRPECRALCDCLGADDAWLLGLPDDEMECVHSRNGLCSPNDVQDAEYERMYEERI